MRLATLWATLLTASVAMLHTANAAQPEPARSLVPTSQPISPAAEANLAEFERRLAAVDMKMAAVTDLRANFEQRKKTAMLKKPLISRGSLFCKGELVLWKTTSPRRTDMLVASDKVTIYYPADQLAEVYALGSRFQDATGGPLPRLSKLRESFELTELDAAVMAKDLAANDSTDRVALTLTPKSDELKKHVASIRVLIDVTVPCADRVVIVDPDGEETELRFTAVKTNTGLKDTELDLNLPAGTKISTPVEPAK